MIATNYPSTYPDYTVVGLIQWPYWEPVPSPSQTEDLRHDRKQMALWFREFLFKIYGRFSRVLVEATQERDTKTPRHLLVLGRQAPTKREWIFKDWVQSL